jgi:two-component system response regulator TctD
VRILVVEDTVDVGEGVVACLRRLGHAVDWVRDGAAADQMLSDSTYDVAVLDLMLPEMDGATVLKRLRLRRSQTPVLVLTARSAIGDRVDVLDLGADDYLVKPFDFRELEARVRALLRRHSGDRTNLLVCQGVSLDRAGRAATVHGQPVRLTRRELSLLEIFLSNPGRIFSKTDLLDQIFGYEGDPSENAVEVMVARLRRKIGDSGAEIETHRGLGYRLAAP